MKKVKGDLPSRRKFKIANKFGLHARAAALLVKAAKRYHATVTVIKGSKKVDGKSIMNVLMLAAGPGTEIDIVTEGHDAEEAMEELAGLINSRFGEP